MARIERVNAVLKAMQERLANAKQDSKASVIVGYQTNYALQLHENVQMKWRGYPRDRSVRLGSGQVRQGGYVTTGHAVSKKHGLFWGPRGQAKYLEEPFRMYASVMAEIVRTAVIKGSRLPQALLLAGLRLQRESQKLVPVDTGTLKNSAFTKLERQHDSQPG